MKKFLICLMVVFIVSACNRSDETPIVHCGGYDVQMTIADDGNTMHANINGDELDLLLVPSASGAKYSGVLNDIVVVLWNKGNTWTMLLDDEEIIDCQVK